MMTPEIDVIASTAALVLDLDRFEFATNAFSGFSRCLSQFSLATTAKTFAWFAGARRYNGCVQANRLVC
jgi:hypothetical protein